MGMAIDMEASDSESRSVASLKCLSIKTTLCKTASLCLLHLTSFALHDKEIRIIFQEQNQDTMPLHFLHF